MTINMKKLAALLCILSFGAQANFVDSPEANDERLLEIIKNYSEANCQSVADDACAKLFLEAVAADPENEDYKYYSKKRKKLITTYNKFNAEAEAAAEAAKVADEAQSEIAEEAPLVDDVVIEEDISLEIEQ